MKKYYVIQIVGSEEYYDGSNSAFENPSDEHFDVISTAMMFDTKEEAMHQIKLCTKVYGYLTIKKVYWID